MTDFGAQVRAAPQPTDCNSFLGVVPPMRQTDTARVERSCATISAEHRVKG